MTTIINTTPKYPGDSIRIALLRRGTEFGDVRIQKYDSGNYRVGSFTPGHETNIPGDTPKMEPDLDLWCGSPADAMREFDHQLARAHKKGWLDYDPDTEARRQFASIHDPATVDRVFGACTCDTREGPRCVPDCHDKPPRVILPTTAARRATRRDAAFETWRNSHASRPLGDADYDREIFFAGWQAALGEKK